jgi:predicted phage baseplate assembly protein
MALPAPNLDDRRFQDLVDDAKRLVQQHCPSWSDHNVSDPGVTLIELFAWMTDQLLYRLNRVPERHYVKFLELIGVRLFPPTAARADVSFWLSAPQPETVGVPPGTQVATRRTETEEAVVFTTVENLEMATCSATGLATITAANAERDESETLDNRHRHFYCFDRSPAVGDTFLVGLSNPVPSCAVALRFDCDIEGVGVDPRRPPLVWEAWTGRRWARCEVDSDATGGLNRAGDVVLHVPRGHASSLAAGRGAAWVRCRVVPAEENQPTYSASPRIKSLAAFTIGGTAAAVHAEVVEGEDLGLAEGVPGQRVPLAHRPVVPSETPPVLEVAGPDGFQEWTRVASFAGHGPDDRVFALDETAGELSFAPAVREPDGSLRRYGAVPPKGALLRLRAYRTGGGPRGNVAKGKLNVLKSSIPYVSRVENRRPAAGGVDGEEVDNAKVRGPLVLRTADRAVTAEDYEQLAREAAPEVARVRCVAAGDGSEAGGVRVLVVPAAADDEFGRLAFDQLIPADETLATIAERLDERRVVGARVSVEPPLYQGVTVAAKLRARPRADRDRLRDDAIRALYRYFHPVRGGPDGDGWPFGRPIHVGEVYAVLQRLAGTELIEDARLLPADPVTGRRGQPTQRLELDKHALAFSFEHRVLVEEG